MLIVIANFSSPTCNELRQDKQTVKEGRFVQYLYIEWMCVIQKITEDPSVMDPSYFV